MTRKTTVMKMMMWMRKQEKAAFCAVAAGAKARENLSTSKSMKVMKRVLWVVLRAMAESQKNKTKAVHQISKGPPHRPSMRQTISTKASAG